MPSKYYETLAHERAHIYQQKIMGKIVGDLKVRCFLSTVALVFFLGSAYAQPKKSLLYNYLDNINSFNQLLPQEKVYLHFDNTGYFMGETIWFKAYVLRDAAGGLTDMSKILYVELVSPNGEIQDRQTLAVNEGTSSGCIHLDKLLMSGYYEVRAYTRYMTNWGKEHVFSRVFPIFEKPSALGDLSCLIENTRHKRRLPDYREAEESKAACQVNFYPEGGHLIAGKENRLAFLVTGSEGAMPHQKCALLSGRDTLKIVTTDQFGRGIFTITPSRDTNSLVVLKKGRSDPMFPLPQAEEAGCVMRVNALGDHFVMMELEATQEYMGRRLALVILHRGNLMVVDTITVGQTAVARKIARTDLGEGVNEFVIIDSEGSILSDRMVFCYPQKDTPPFTAKILMTHQGGDRRRKAVFKTLPHLKFSVSIRDYDKDVNGAYGSICSWLLLSSDLKGYIANPDYYLESDDREHRLAADLLMLVQGWRRYDMSVMLGRKKFYYEQPIEKSLSLHGRIHGRKSDAAVESKTVAITMYDKSGQVVEGKCETDSLGYFAFQMPEIYGEWTMFINMQEKKDNKKYFVSLDRNFSPECRYLQPEEVSPQLGMPLVITAETAVDNTVVTYGKMDEKAHLIPTVNVKARHLFKDARKYWETEKRGAYAASIYYDCVAEAEKIADTGAELPGIFEWLKTRNEYFSGSTSRMYDTKNGSGERDDSTLVIDEYDRRRWDPTFGKAKSGRETSNAFNIDPLGKYYDPEITYGHYLLLERDGLSYKNRPIVWILDNAFYYVSYVPTSCKLYDIQSLLATTFEFMPESLSDFKSVYISENQEIWHRYLRLPKLESMAPVTVFLYAFHSKEKKKEYLRKTHYTGFPPMETFEMPDYSVLPKTDDFRRTLYWNPDVETDKNGEASVEFYNNNTCQRFVISAEGISDMGEPVVCK